MQMLLHTSITGPTEHVSQAHSEVVMVSCGLLVMQYGPKRLGQRAHVHLGLVWLRQLPFSAA